MAKLFAVLISSLRLFQSRLPLNFNEFVPNLCDLAGGSLQSILILKSYSTTFLVKRSHIYRGFKWLSALYTSTISFCRFPSFSKPSLYISHSVIAIFPSAASFTVSSLLVFTIGHLSQQFSSHLQDNFLLVVREVIESLISLCFLQVRCTREYFNDQGKWGAGPHCCRGSSIKGVRLFLPVFNPPPPVHACPLFA